MGKPRKHIRSKKNPAKCAKKQRFETIEQAKKAAFRPGLMNRIWGYMSAYKCPTCKKYHYGHPIGYG